MNISRNKQGRVDDYLSGKMKAGERSAFEEEVKQDAELAELLDFSRRVRAQLLWRRQHLQQMQQWKCERNADVRPPYTTVAAAIFRSALRWRGRLAVVLVCCLGGGLWWWHAERAQKNELPVEMVATYRGTDVTWEVESLMTCRKYPEALQVVDSLLGTMREDGRGQSVLSPVEETEEEAYSRELDRLTENRLEWLEIRILLALEQRQQALEKLETFRQRPGEFKEEAEQLWKSLSAADTLRGKGKSAVGR